MAEIKQCQTRLSFRLNQDYDADLIEHLSRYKNRSKELRRILRAGLKVMSDKSPEKQKDGTAVPSWRFPS